MRTRPARLIGTAYGADRTGGAVAAIERAPSNTGTLWAATGTGRVFISDNADAAAASVTFTRLDTVGDERSEPVRLVDLRRPDEPEPRVDLLLRLQHQHAGAAGSRVPR